MPNMHEIEVLEKTRRIEKKKYLELWQQRLFQIWCNMSKKIQDSLQVPCRRKRKPHLNTLLMYTSYTFEVYFLYTSKICLTFSLKFNIWILYDPLISLWDINPTEMCAYVHRDMNKNTYRIIIYKSINWKEPKCLSG